jgi:hypothetical protein
MKSELFNKLVEILEDYQDNLNGIQSLHNEWNSCERVKMGTEKYAYKIIELFENTKS